MSGTLDPATVDRVLASAGRLRGDAAVPLVIVARQRATVLWANDAARAVLGASDLARLGSLLFAGGPAAQVIAGRLAAMRPGEAPRLECVRPGGDWIGVPHLVRCHAVDDAGVEPLAVLQWTEPLAVEAPVATPEPAADHAGGAPTGEPADDEREVRPAPGRRVLWSADSDGRVIAVDPAFAATFGADALVPGEHLPSRLRALDPLVADAVERVLEQGGSLATSRLDWPHGPAGTAPVEIGCTRRRGAAGGLTGFCILPGAAMAEAASGPPQAPAEAPEPVLAVDTATPVPSKSTASEAAMPGPDLPEPNGSQAGAADKPDNPATPPDQPAMSDTGYGAARAGLGGNVVHFPAMRAAAVPAVFAPEMRSGSALPPAPREDAAEVTLKAPLWSEAPSSDAAASELSADERDAFAQIGEVLGTKPAAVPGRDRAVAAASGPDLLAPILDRLPIGLVWRIDGVTAANAAFRERAGFTSEFLPDDLLPPDATGPQVELRGMGDTRLVVRHHEVFLPQGDASLFVLADERAREAAPVVTPAVPSGVDLGSGDGVLDIAADGSAMLEDDGTIARLSAGGARLFGYDPAELAGRPLADLAAPEGRDSWRALLTTESAEATSHELVGRARDGRLVPVVARVGRVAANGLLVAFTDDAARQRAITGLDAARREAERTSALKSDFLARVSHEIRTPLNAILGFAEMIRDERLGPVGNSRYVDYLKDIHASGTHVMSLVNDLLDLSRIEAGRMDLKLEAVDANAIVNACVSTLQTQANRERIIVRLSLTPSLPAALADERSLRQIVLNLLSNAIKFNEPGGQVIVSTALAESGSVAIRIRDTGIGMTDAEIGTAMEPFRQVAAVQRAGSGLGLPVTKALVEANCASMTIRSTPGQGTLVEVTFPMVEHNSMSLPAQ